LILYFHPKDFNTKIIKKVQMNQNLYRIIDLPK
jgi:hypothetical protein